MKPQNSPVQSQRGQCRHLLPLILATLTLGTVVAPSLLAQPAGPYRITGPTDPNLVLDSKSAVYAEYYGADNGPLTINGVTFQNNNARLGTASITTKNLPYFGATTDCTNLALISESDVWSGAGFDVYLPLPTILGRTYMLQLIFHDNFYNTTGSRVFAVSAGQSGLNTLADSLDLVQAGAGYSDNADVVLTYTFTNIDGSPLEVWLVPGVNNPQISALTLQDMSAPPVPPLVTIPPTSQNNYVGRTTVLKCTASGTGLSYQWKAAPIGSSSYVNVNDGNGISGSKTATLTIANTKLANAMDYVVVVSNAAGSATSDPATLTVLAVPGLAVITSPADTNLILNGNFVLSEYYGADLGPLQIGGVTFYNNNARLPGGNISTQPQYLPNFGTSQDATNLALISDSDLWSSAGFDFILPTVKGRSYVLQLILHDNYISAAGGRLFDVWAGPTGNFSLWAQNLDLAALGAGTSNAVDVILTYNLTNSDGNGLEIILSPDAIQNPMISALTLRDVSPAPVPPLMTIQPVSQTLFAGRTLVLSSVVSGTPLNCQWQAGASGSGAFTNLTDNGNVSGSKTLTLTITNIQEASSADYQLIVSNGAGSVTNDVPVTVTVLPTTPITPDVNYAYAVITNGAVDYWRLGEPNGSPMLYDVGPNAKDGTMGAGAVLDASGPSSPNFPGFESKNACLQTWYGNIPAPTMPPLNLNTNMVTILAWINPSGNQAPGSGIFLSRSGNISNYCSGISFHTTAAPDGDYPLNYIWNGDFWQTNSGIEVPHDTWSLVGLVVTPTNATIYVINASGLASWSTRNVHTNCPFTNPTLIANDAFDSRGARMFNGLMDEVAVFNKALSTTQIMDLFSKATGKLELPPTVTAPPAITIVNPGATATISCSGNGAPTPVYQWMARGLGPMGDYTNVVDGGNIAGSQTPTLVISNATAANAGDFVLVVSNKLGVVTSASGRLLINQPLPPVMLGQWLNGGQDMQDKVGFDGAGVHDGSIWGSGSPTWESDVPAGFSGYSIHLDGASAVMIGNTAQSDSDYRLTFDNQISQKFTIAFWAKGFPPHGWHPLVTKGGENSMGWQVRADANGNGGNPTFTIRGPGNDDAGNGAPLNLDDGGWHHYAATYDGVIGLRRLYVDGMMEINLNNNRGTITPANIDHLVLGAIESTANFNGNYFTGNLFDVRVYSYAISLGEVQALIHPAEANSVRLLLSSGIQVPLGHKETFTVVIPAGANATSPVHVWVTNNAPSVAVIEGATGNVFSVTFAAGSPTSRSFILDVIGTGQINLSVGSDSGLSSTLTTASVSPALIGQWINGTPDLTDKSGFTSAGTHDGLASTGSTLGSATASFASDVPAGFSGQSLALDGNYMIAIQNSSTIDANYQSTFDVDIADAFTVSFWAKGMPNGWGTWVAKRGEDVVGWKVRNHGSDNAPCFTIRDTPGPDDNFNSVTRLYEGTNWHHFVATWDSVDGRKLYVDGKLDFIVPNDNGPLPPPIRNYLTIGGMDNNNNTATPTFSGGTFTCKMFDVRMYNYALNGSEVPNLMNPTNASLVATADSSIIDLGHTATVYFTLPNGANSTRPVTVWVTNLNPNVVSINGATGDVFPVLFQTGAYPSMQLTITGISEGQAQIAFGSDGMGSAAETVQVYGPHLVGRWFAGNTNLVECSGFMPAGTHDGRLVGSIPANMGYSTDVPTGFDGFSADLTNVNSAPQVGVLITNTAASDSGYATTFDDLIVHKFTITFWAKLVAPYAQQWTPFISKRGEDGMGFQVRRHGGDAQEAFTLRGTALLGGNDDAWGSVIITNTGVWRHYAAVWDGYNGTRQMYVNGVLDPSINLTNDFGPFMMGKGHHLVIGARENNTVIGPNGNPSLDGNCGFNGRLYDVRVYNYPLTAMEVQGLLASAQGPQLSIAVASDGSVRISWPTSAAGYVLQSSSDVSGSWSDSGLSVTTEGNENVATVTAGSNIRFYRLKK